MRPVGGAMQRGLHCDRVFQLLAGLHPAPPLDHLGTALCLDREFDDAVHVAWVRLRRDLAEGILV